MGKIKISPLMKENLLKLKKSFNKNSALKEDGYECTLIDVCINDLNNFVVDVSAEKLAEFRTFMGSEDMMFKENYLFSGHSEYKDLNLEKEDLDVLKQVLSGLTEIMNTLDLRYIIIRLAEFQREDTFVGIGRGFNGEEFTTKGFDFFNLVGKAHHQRSIG